MFCGPGADQREARGSRYLGQVFPSQSGFGFSGRSLGNG
jgi:hypothetical protein